MGIFGKDEKKDAMTVPVARDPFAPVEPAGPESFGGSDFAAQPDDDNGGPAGWTPDPTVTPREEGAREQAAATEATRADALRPYALTEVYDTDGKATGQGLKKGKTKLRWSLLPWAALGAVVAVFEWGAAKYAANNWKNTDPGEAEAIYNEALLRHVAAFQQGVVIDPDSKKPVLAHIVADGLICLHFALRRARALGAPEE